ncbi:PhoG like DNA-binding family-domain-containing protein [Lipomyces orientalis]|uniref:PhoG like DNA-binding family-domain-containing protein n=1 Tax=Lipomyces orientalis TaxID=1233043 RepID=A0ACC3TUS4_9ASCO
MTTSAPRPEPLPAQYAIPLALEPSPPALLLPTAYHAGLLSPALSPVSSLHPALSSQNAPLSGLQFIFPRASRPLLCTPSFSGLAPISHLQQPNLHAVRVQINAAISRGLRFESARWLAYRRNYLSITINVVFDIPLSALPTPQPSSSPLLPRSRQSVDNHNFSIVLDLRNGSQRVVKVKFFAVTVVAEDEVNGRPVELVQHTSKRDQGPRRKPVVARIRPTLSDGRIMATPISHPASLGAHGLVEDFIPMDRPASAGLSSNNPTRGSSTSPDYSTGHDSEHEQTSFDLNHESAEIVCFERIQFKRATANNGRKNTAQQMFRVVAILYAAVDETECFDGVVSNAEHGMNGIRYLEIQRVATGGVMVRGRSPGHYADRVGGGGMIQ